MLVLIDSDPFVISRIGPPYELDDEIDFLFVANGRESEQITNIDDPDTSQLHVVSARLFAKAPKLSAGISLDGDQVVGHQTVATADELERRLAFADPALADQQDTEAENFQQHTVNSLSRDELVLEEEADALDRGRGERTGRQDRNSALLASSYEGFWRAKPFGRDEDRHILRGDRTQSLGPKIIIQGGEELELALADDLDPARLDVFVEAGERQSRLLHPWVKDQAL